VSASDVRWIERWVQVLESACPDDLTVALRLSAARSLQHAGLLSAARSTGASRSAELAAVTLRASLVALTLLQVSSCSLHSLLVARERSDWGLWGIFSFTGRR
jgi:hypothetical protein